MSDKPWITVDFLSRALSGENVRVLSFELEPATKKGDNYASEMYRAIVNFETIAGERGKRNLILKIMPSGEIQRQVMEQNNIYPREIAIYREIIPRIERLLRSIDDDTVISPKCFLTVDDPEQTLVFEDAKEAGFRMIDSRVGLDVHQASLALAKLAKLHACSRMVYEEDPKLFDMMLEGCINQDPKKQAYVPYYRMCVEQVISLVIEWDQVEWSAILQKLRNLVDKIIPYGCEVYERDETAFNVLTHNDIWTNNMLFRYADDDRTVQDILLLDYQLSYFGSPGVDLNFFIYGAALKPDVREEHWMDLVQHYHDVLRSTLEKLDYKGKIPTLPEIHVEITRKGFHRVNAVFQQMPIALMEDAADAEMDLLLQASEKGHAARRKIFTNPRYVRLLRGLLTQFNRMGYLD